MDLGFPRFDKDMPLSALPADLALLMVGIAARQAVSPTALAQIRIARVPFEATLFAPLDGAFNGPVAASLVRWKEE